MLIAAAGCAFAAALSPLAGAFEGAGADAGSLPGILVIGTSPVPGLNIDADKIPGNVQTVSAADLRRDGTASLINGLNSRLGSVNINDSLADPFQPDILYRGFEASPVLGTPQGLAVYQNGVRINEAFGDTVNWDLFPDIAVERIDLVSANPLYGLNALGGALSLTMKNGFSSPGTDAEVSGGSFNLRETGAEFGANKGVFGFYAAARALNQDGWRLFAHDSLRQYYLDLSIHELGANFDLSYSRADNHLFGPGAAPIQSIAVNPTIDFTGPQSNFNTLNFVTLDATLALSGTASLQSVLYSRNLRQRVRNGNASNFIACAQISALCQADGLTPLSNAAGGLIPDITQGGTLLIGSDDSEAIASQAWGASLQLAGIHSFFDRGNEFAAGATFDTSQTNFRMATQVGLLNSELIVLPSGLSVDTPEGTPYPATPVIMNANDKYYGLFVTDTLDATAQLSVTASARYNVAKIGLSDLRGSALNGNNRFCHLNPAIGATYKISPNVTGYLGYSTNSRAPTPGEIECSDPLKPCLLPSSLAGDPPNLRQVIAHTAEAGLRGHAQSAATGKRLSWNAGAFTTTSKDDIFGISTSLSAGFFQNIGSTRRRGFESGLNYDGEPWSVYAQYSFIDATFRSALTLRSPSNPFHDLNGDIHVIPGDRLPLIPRNRLKLGADYALLPSWSVGASLVLATASFYRGDESNQNPPLTGHHVFGLRTSWRPAHHLEVFAQVQNLLDERYSTVGIFSDPTGVNAPGIPAGANSNDPRVDHRFQSLGMPRAFFGGVRLSF